MVMAIVSAKGGTGKSTIALNLASVLTGDDQTVCVVDADPQGSIARWNEIRRQDQPVVVVEPSPVPGKMVKKLNGRNDLVILDSPPTFKKRMKAVLRAADLVIIPVTPGPADLWSTSQLVDVYLAEKEARPELDARLLINRLDRRIRYAREFRYALEALSIPVFITELGQRSVYGEAWSAGMTVDRFQPSCAAAKELRRLASEVTRWRAHAWLAM